MNEEVIAGIILIPLLIGFFGYSIFNWVRFQKIKKEYAGVFTTNQVKRYINWRPWPVLIIFGLATPICSFFMEEFSITYGLTGGLVFVLFGLFSRWRCNSIYAKALERCPDELKPGLRRALTTVSWICQWRFVFAIFGAAGQIAAFNAVMEHGGTIIVTTTTKTVREHEDNSIV